MRHRQPWIAPTVLGVALIAAWAVLTNIGIISAYALPAPQEVVRRVVTGFHAGFLGASLSQTLLEALLGCVVAAFFGVPLGFGIAHFRALSASVEPYLAASQAIPAIAIAPLLVAWIGYGTSPIVVLCTIMVVFPVIISTAVGVRHIDQELIGAARLDGAGGFTLLRTIELPLAGPNIMAGLRTGFTLSITGAVVGEMVIGGQRGLGIELVTAQHVNDIPGMFAVIAVLATVAVALYLLLRWLEYRVVRAVAAE